MNDRTLTVEEEEKIADLAVYGYGLNEIVKQLHKPCEVIVRYLNDSDREIDFDDLPGFKYGY